MRFYYAFLILPLVGAVEESSQPAEKKAAQLRRRAKAQLFDVAPPVPEQAAKINVDEAANNNMVKEEEQDLWNRLLGTYSNGGSMDMETQKSPGWPWY